MNGLRQKETSGSPLDRYCESVLHVYLQNNPLHEENQRVSDGHDNTWHGVTKAIDPVHFTVRFSFKRMSLEAG